MVSIIVPAYNAERYLRQCVQSVLAQTYSEWELILVDDGSTDSTPSICDELRGNDERIHVIHRENGGPSAARNSGLDVAKGCHILFLDADDLLPPEALGVLVNEAGRSGADIVSGLPVKFSGENPPEAKCRVESSHVSGAEEAVASILYQEGLEDSFSYKLFDSRLWRDHRFREGIRYEDLDLMYRLVLDNAASVAVTDAEVYYYRQHPGSYIHTFTLGRSVVLDVTARLTSYIADRYPALLPAARSRELSANFNILLLLLLNRSKLIKKASRENSREDAERIKREIDSLRRRCVEKIRSLRRGVAHDPRARLKNRLASLLPI